MTARDHFNTLAPEFQVQINGSALPQPARADLVRVSVLDDVDATGMFELTLNAWNTAEMKPKWLDDALFQEGNAVDIALGYRDQTTPLLSGEITGLEPEFAEHRAPTLTVRGHDRRHRLMRARRTRSFLQMKDSDIVRQIATEAGLDPQVSDSGPSLPYVLQHNQTDLEFLMTRARRIAFELLAEQRKLVFRPRPTDAGPALTLHREVELLSFRPRLSTLGQITSCEVRGWDPAQKKALVAQAGGGDAGKLLGGSRSGPQATQRAFSDAASGRVATPVQSQDEADAMARRGFAEMALGYVRAEGVCIGDPRLHAGMVVEVAGIGQRFGGAYYLTAVEHSFVPARGFRTAFSARRNAA